LAQAGAKRKRNAHCHREKRNDAPTAMITPYNEIAASRRFS
jgi:hypothetical protein